MMCAAGRLAGSLLRRIAEMRMGERTLSKEKLAPMGMEGSLAAFWWGRWRTGNRHLKPTCCHIWLGHLLQRTEECLSASIGRLVLLDLQTHLGRRRVAEFTWASKTCCYRKTSKSCRTRPFASIHPPIA